MRFCIQITVSSEALCCEMRSHLAKMFIIEPKWGRIVDEVDAKSWDWTIIFEHTLGTALLFLRKAVKFGTVGNKMVNMVRKRVSSRLAYFF